MPSDTDMTEGEIDMYEQVRQFFVANPNPESVPLFLNSFGDGSGFGVYQRVGAVLRTHQPGVVVPHLALSLRSFSPSVRSWSAEIAAEFPHQDLVEPLAALLIADPDDGTRYFAASALAFIEGGAARAALQRAATTETDAEVAEHISEALAHKAECG